MNIHQVMITQGHLLNESLMSNVQYKLENFHQDLADFVLSREDLGARDLSVIGRALIYSLYISDIQANCAIAAKLNFNTKESKKE